MFVERFAATFPALRHRNFRLFWLGQCVSLIGTWMQNVGQSWLVLQLTGSAWLLGVVGALQFLPMLFLALFAGVIVDRFSKRKILIFTQSVLMLQALILAVLVWSGTIRYWEIVVLATLLGLVTTIDHPTRQSYLIELVGKEDLMNAVALNSSIFNAARIIGPAVAGMLMAFLSIASCFLLNGLSFIAVLIGLWRITDSPVTLGEKKRVNVLGEIKEGLNYARSNRRISATLLMVAVVSVFAMNFNVLVPVFAQQELGQQAGGYGFLVSAMGAGALLGAITLAVLNRKAPKLSFLAKAGMLLGGSLVVLGLQRIYWVSLLILAFSGWSMIMFNASANTTLQLSSPDHLRGRVMSLFSLVFAGISPFGSLFSGAMAHWSGAGETFIVSGGIVVVFLILMVLSRHESGDGSPA